MSFLDDSNNQQKQALYIEFLIHLQDANASIDFLSLPVKNEVVLVYYSVQNKYVYNKQGLQRGQIIEEGFSEKRNGLLLVWNTTQKSHIHTVGI